LTALGRLLVLIALAALARPALAERVVLVVAGVSIERPSTWIQVSGPQTLAGAARSGYGSAELRERMQQALAAGPFVAFGKATGRHANVAPMVRLHVRPRLDLGGRTLTDMLRRSYDQLARSIPDVRYVEEPAANARFGPGGAVMKIAYTLGTGASAVTVRSQNWVVERGDRLISVSITMAEDEAAAIWPEADAILDTIRFDEP